MKNTIITWVLFFTVGLVSTASVNQVKKIKYTVKKVEGTWLVVNEQNQPVSIQANKKDDIEWTAEGSDLIFQFPGELSTFFTKEDGTPVGNGYYINVSDGAKLKFKVKDNAPTGTYVYAVLVKKEGVFAEGSSPPVMIIK